MHGVSQGIVAAILGLWLYSLAVQKLGAARGSLFGALVPAIAICGGFLFLFEVPTEYETIGVILTTIGIIISMKGTKDE
ncbi:EamA family transporter [Marinomonas sp. 2405UD68-3]|uniref:EamA family transporter n=1 Tax=Marinomonas sp. 2405UD68-3 TaxID=3391835 RepID=UPI0039C99884